MPGARTRSPLGPCALACLVLAGRAAAQPANPVPVREALRDANEDGVPDRLGKRAAVAGVLIDDPRPVELITALDPDLGRVRADRGQMERVDMNLVVNARDAMPQGGKLTLRTGTAENGSGVALTITDTGCGMDAETRSHLFEPFFTTKELGKGTGLGLSTVYGIVQQSGGQLEVWSEPGRGTSFQIRLPRTEDQIEAPAAALPALPPGRETILLVEDEDGVRSLTRAILERSGYEVLEASNGVEALRLAASRAEGIDLLLTDVVMPEMDGRSLARRLAASRSETRILYMSGYIDQVLEDQGRGPGGAFLQKPFLADILLSKVRETLELQ